MEEVIRIKVPLQPDLVKEIFALWSLFFPPTDEDFREVYGGQESGHNEDIMYLMRDGKGRIMGTAHLTMNKMGPTLGGVGGVATDLDYRQRGVAAKVCGRLREDFISAGGQALFLGTENPVAIRVYHRLGWRKLASADAMVLVRDHRSPEKYLVDYFEKIEPFQIVPGSPADRLPMVPLIMTPHDWLVLDANIPIFSTRYVTQKSCGGLYQKYEGLLAGNHGTWFIARSVDGRIVGIASARLSSDRQCQVDGFTHPHFDGAWNGLIRHAMDWGVARGATSWLARVSGIDDDKRKRFEALRFTPAGKGEPFEINGTSLDCPELLVRIDS